MIQLKGVCKKYDKSPVAGPLDLDVNCGECMALVGGNGAGKSTVLRLIAGLLRPTAGDLWVSGYAAGTKAAKNLLFYLPQKMVLPRHLTLREAVLFFTNLRRKPDPNLLELAHLYQLSHVMDQAIGTFSGGMVQRLGLLIADAVDCPILLLDEPTSNLDQAGIQLFFERMERWRKTDKTILFASHAIGEINQLADRYIRLESGIIREDVRKSPNTVFFSVGNGG